MLPPTRSQSGPTPTAARRLAGYQAALTAFDAPHPYTVTAGAPLAGGGRGPPAFPQAKRPPTPGPAPRDQGPSRGVGAGAAAGVPRAGPRSRSVLYGHPQAT